MYDEAETKSRTGAPQRGQTSKRYGAPLTTVRGSRREVEYLMPQDGCISMSRPSADHSGSPTHSQRIECDARIPRLVAPVPLYNR